MQAQKVDQKGSRNLKRKRQVREYLVHSDHTALSDWVGRQNDPLRTLVSLLFDDEELIRWRAIEAIGLLAPQEFSKNPERIRVLIRRILWLMNDESGGICWVGPETIGELLYSVPLLIQEFGPILPSFFFEEPFQKGSRWAVARVASVDKDFFQYTSKPLLDSLNSLEAEIRGFSILALTALDIPIPIDILSNLNSDKSKVRLYNYENKQLQDKSIAELLINVTSTSGI